MRSIIILTLLASCGKNPTLAELKNTNDNLNVAMENTTDPTTQENIQTAIDFERIQMGKFEGFDLAVKETQRELHRNRVKREEEN
jgi:hypothetical protein